MQGTHPFPPAAIVILAKKQTCVHSLMQNQHTQLMAKILF